MLEMLWTILQLAVVLMGLVAVVGAVFIMILESVEHITDSHNGKEVIATCPRCNTTQIIGYSFLRPKKRMCPLCGTEIKCRKV